MTISRVTFAMATIQLVHCCALQPTLSQPPTGQSSILQSSGAVPNEQTTTRSLEAPDARQTASFMKGTERFTFPVAMNGYCPVSIHDKRAWVEGSDRHTVLLDGMLYFFASEQQKQDFLMNPTRYAPALRGDSVVNAFEQQLRTPGAIEFAAIHKGRIYFFPDQPTKDKFMEEPSKYERVDLAFDGKCIVSLVDQQHDVAGKTEFATIVNGMRFYFADESYKKLFLKNPSKYLTSGTPQNR